MPQRLGKMNYFSQSSPQKRFLSVSNGTISIVKFNGRTIHEWQAQNVSCEPSKNIFGRYNDVNGLLLHTPEGTFDVAHRSFSFMPAPPDDIISALTNAGATLKAPPEKVAPAGWYPDPQNPGTLWYWNGEKWTGANAPATREVAPEEP